MTNEQTRAWSDYWGDYDRPAPLATLDVPTWRLPMPERAERLYAESMEAEWEPYQEWSNGSAYRAALACANAPEWAVYWFRALTGQTLRGLAAHAAEAVRHFVTDEEWRARALEYAEWEQDATPYDACDVIESLPVAV